MQQEYIEVQARENLGKGHNRRLREKGFIPGIVYGGDRGPVSIAINEKDVWNMLHAETGKNTVRLLKLAGTDMQRHVMIKDFEINHITKKLIHADFIRVNTDQTVEVTVPVELVGTPVGVKEEGGMVDFITRELDIIAKVLEIPKSITVDITKLHLHDSIRVEDLDVDKVEFIDTPDRVIVKVDTIRVMEVETEEEEEGEVAEVSEATEEAAE